MMHILATLGFSEKEVYGFFLFAFVGFAGMVVHWAKKWLREQTKAGLFKYLFVVNPRYTALSALTYLGALAGILAVAEIDFANSQSLAMAFMAGYMIDSALNKDKPDEPF